MSEVLSGCELRTQNGDVVTADDALKEKIVGLYFSAHWCFWCRRFTPTLKEFYEEVGNEEMEIIFVTADRNEKAMMDYYNDSHAKWLYIPFGNSHIDMLWKKYGVRTMPTLIIIKPDGSVITRNGVSNVKRRKPTETLRQWKYGEVVEESKKKCSIM
ncbi:unnamed protein product [Anisakis simplex]|uniref:Nucleoredoxin-like protein 2 (inferred by orthology to a human protein) n=1 Tax=Anisakis simplex TaxID=6269 RepID=A0A0M3JY60_ANISI|nr:unnamed protein product [Anisakis simplex]